MMKEIFNYTLDEYESVVIVTTVNGATRVIIKADEEKALSAKPSTPVLSKESLSESQLEIFEELRALRKSLSETEKVRPYFIFTDKSLVDMALKLPVTRDEFIEIYGVGESKLNKYGDIFIHKINNLLGCVPD